MVKQIAWPIFIVAASLLYCARVLAQEGAVEPIYRFDPALSLKSPRQTTLSADPQFIVIDKDEQETTLRLQTEIPISPYFGAERGPSLSPEETRLLGEGEEHDIFSDYKLEAGVGLHVEDKTSLTLGYRFQNTPSLLNERRNDPLSISGDLRITFDVKVPF